MIGVEKKRKESKDGELEHGENTKVSESSWPVGGEKKKKCIRVAQQVLVLFSPVRHH